MIHSAALPGQRYYGYVYMFLCRGHHRRLNLHQPHTNELFAVVRRHMLVRVRICRLLIRLLSGAPRAVHVINSCIVKMGKLTKACPVYRGMSMRIFPPEFWTKNEQGVKGGIEYAFMSTTPDRSVAEQYSQDGYGIIVEINQGMIDRGAEIAWLSQVCMHAHLEKEMRRRCSPCP